ncbi:uncharacterized protein ARMOST_18456 [Armillaria ostoyae]|uniref:Uncharacterized protein n=1 Tax=Armillaria ostoyae TaxID=47428 RepID=A0A284S1U8_ARMOS|nr:uncharacterized protein ARMOST_18456 [Armillaria ostoyae]
MWRKTPRRAHEPSPFSTRVPVNDIEFCTFCGQVTEAKTKRFRLTILRINLLTISTVETPFGHCRCRRIPWRPVKDWASDPQIPTSYNRLLVVQSQDEPHPTTSVSMVILSLGSARAPQLAMNSSPQMREDIINPSECCCITSSAQYRPLQTSKPPEPRAPNLLVNALLYLILPSSPISSPVYPFRTIVPEAIPVSSYRLHSSL